MTYVECSMFNVQCSTGGGVLYASGIAIMLRFGIVKSSRAVVAVFFAYGLPLAVPA